MKTINDIVTNGESETVEFKKSFDKDAIETLSAFANTTGVRSFIGITQAQ